MSEGFHADRVLELAQKRLEGWSYTIRMSSHAPYVASCIFDPFVAPEGFPTVISSHPSPTQREANLCLRIKLLQLLNVNLRSCRLSPLQLVLRLHTHLQRSILDPSHRTRLELHRIRKLRDWFFPVKIKSDG